MKTTKTMSLVIAMAMSVSMAGEARADGVAAVTATPAPARISTTFVDRTERDRVSANVRMALASPDCGFQLQPSGAILGAVGVIVVAYVVIAVIVAASTSHDTSDEGCEGDCFL